MISCNDMQIGIKESWYNKTTIQEDGVTQVVDTSKTYPLYQVQIMKNYFDVDMYSLLPEIISDLQQIISKLQEIQKQENKEKDENCR